MDEMLDAVAIVGLAGRFPGADDVEQFWNNLRDGVEAITFLQDDELPDGAQASDPNYIKAAALLDGADLFDAAFFGYNPREAETMDPQHRVFLETAWTALEHAGYTADLYEGLISVFAGAGMNRYLLYNLAPNQELVRSLGEAQMMVGNDKDFLATRAAYKLNLKGAAVNVQTACSSSLVAVHLACQSLLSRECDMALAGGITIAVPQKNGYLYHEGGIASKDGHTRTFDAQATGTVFGSGVGVVVVKRLEDALEDGDTIYAVIKGSAINNDGSQKVSYTAPSIEGQVGVISEALAIGGVEPETVSYIEAHGTATPLGDPIEIASLTKVFRAATAAEQFCAIGSVKTNVGHLDIAAGVTGLIKTTLTLAHKQLPPSLHFEKANEAIDFASSPFYVNTELTDWKSDGPRRAGVSSFGFGGTNAHVVLEEAPAQEDSGLSREWQLVVLSAKTSSALETATERLAAHVRELDTEQKFADAAYTLQVGRKAFAHRRMLVCRDGEEAAELLAARDPKRVLSGVREEGTGKRPIAFLFSGTGSQYVNMARELYETEPLFQEEVDACCEVLTPLLGLDLRDLLYPEEGLEEGAAQQLKRTKYAQPAIFVVEYALAKLLLEWGIAPSAMIGHSLGEYVAACLAGVFAPEDALTLVAKRAQMIEELPGGDMLAVHLSEQELLAHLARHRAVALAAVNGPQLCVVSGPSEAVAQLRQELEGLDVVCKRVHTTHAFHSAMVEPMMAAFAELVRSMRPQAPELPYLSNVTGMWITADEAVDPQYWARHLRETVRFADGVQELSREPDVILIEVGPGKALASFALSIKPEDNPGRAVLTSIRHVQDETSDAAFLLNLLGRLWLLGAEVDWRAFSADENRRRVPLPTYPFERKRFWIEPQEVRAETKVRRKGVQEWLSVPVWKQTRPLPKLKAPLRSERWLIFADASGLGEKLAERLASLGGQDVTMVRAGDAFGKTGSGAYRMNPAQAEDYRSLIADLGEKVPQKIVHLWSAEHDGFMSLLWLTKALGRQAVTDDIELFAAGSLEEDREPEGAAVIGLCNVIPQEYPNLSCRLIDVAMDGKRVPEQLLMEFCSDQKEPRVSYRGLQRYVQTFEAVEPTAGKLRENGVYLITEGLHPAAGLPIAKHLAQTAGAKLVLTTSLTSLAQPAETVRAFEELGAEILVVQADVTVAEEMEAAVAAAYERFGALNGVVHAAGVFEEEAFTAISETGTAERDAHAAPKVQGARVLETVLRERDIDFCLLISSLSAVLGGLGFAAHAGVHAVLDAFAVQQYFAEGKPWMTLNLDLDLLQEHPELIGHALRVESAVQLVVSAEDVNESLRRRESLPAVETALTTTAHPRPNLLTAYVAPGNNAEEKIAGFWRELLGIEDIGVHDDFFELGGNSLLATKLVARLRGAYRVEVPLRVIFEASTVHDLTYVVEDLLITQLEAMDDERARSLSISRE